MPPKSINIFATVNRDSAVGLEKTA